LFIEYLTVSMLSFAFEDKEAHAIENLSEEELEFQAIYSPPFKPGEVKQ